MQKTVYECDGCKKAIGEVAHITLVLQTNHPGTGLAVPPGIELPGYSSIATWRTVKLPRNFLHFHFACIEKFFRKVEKDATAKVEKKMGKK